MPDQPSHKILLGFDFGTSRIGVAIGQVITKSANPLVILKAQHGNPDWAEIEALIHTWHADALVVGIPYNMDGSEQPITTAARQFGKQLEKHFNLPVYLIDERLTTVEAKQQMFDQGYASTELQFVDSYAAKLILESWLGTYTE